jgi:hypothetical protein
MKLPIFRRIAPALLVLATAASQSALHAQAQFLTGAPYPFDFDNCNDPTELAPGCGAGEGLNVVTVYPHGDIFSTVSARQLCQAVAETVPGNPAYVQARYPADTYTYLCEPPQSPYPAGPQCRPAAQPGCPADDCFCLQSPNAALIRMKIHGLVDLGGRPLVQNVLFPANGGSFWLGSPGNFATYQDLANAMGLTSAGATRGTITTIDPATGAFQTIQAGSTPATLTIADHTRGFRVTNPDPFHWVSDGSLLLPKIRTYNNYYCINGTGNGTGFSWTIEIPGVGTIGNATVTTVNGATATQLAQQLAQEINASAGTTGMYTIPNVPTGACFQIVNSNSNGFTLWMGPSGATWPSGNPCAVTLTGCTYNPTITMSATVPTLGTVASITLAVLLLIATAFLLR